MKPARVYAHTRPGSNWLRESLHSPRHDTQFDVPRDGGRSIHRRIRSMSLAILLVGTLVSLPVEADTGVSNVFSLDLRATAPSHPVILLAHGFCSDGNTWARFVENLQSLNDRFGTDAPVALYFDGRLVVVRNPDGSDDRSATFDPSTGATSIKRSPLYAIWYRNTQRNTFAPNAVRDVPILELGSQLSAVVQAIQATNDGAPVDVVAHSMGGLVSRVSLQGLSSRPLKPDAVRRLVTIDTPHGGFDGGSFDFCESPIAQLLNPVCIVLEPWLDCALSDSTQKREMDTANRGLLLDPLNTRDLPAGTTVNAIVTRGFDGVSDFLVSEASQDLKSQPRFVCAPNVLTDLQDSPDLVAHTTVLADMQTANRAYSFLARANPASGLCTPSIPGAAVTVYGGAGSDSGAVTVSLVFGPVVGGLRAERAEACTADIIAVGPDGAELGRRTVPATGRQVAQFGILPVTGWHLQVVTGCARDVSSQVVVQPASQFGPARSGSVVPVVLDVATGVAHYTSEVTLTNRGVTPAVVTMQFSASTGQMSGRVGRLVPAGTQTMLPSATTWLKLQGIPLPSDGTPVVGTLAVDWEGLSDPTASAVLTRTTTTTGSPQPIGAAGLAYGSVGTSPAAGSMTIFGLRQNVSDRSNLAVFNPSNEPVTVELVAVAGDASGFSRIISDGQTVPAHGWHQWNNVLDGTGIRNGWVTIRRISTNGLFDAYGVINDNLTNDGSFIVPSAGGGGGTSVTVPVLVETGAFRSELVLANKSENTVTLTLDYRESLSPSHGTGGPTTVSLAPKEQLILPEAVGFLRSRGVAVGPVGLAAYAGSLRISVSGAPVEDVYAGARTAAQSPAGGQFGLFTPGIYENEAAQADAYVYGLRSDERNRTNVAVANVGKESSGPVTLALHFFDGDSGGVERPGVETVTLAPGEWRQFSSILQAKGIRNGWVHVVRTSGSASWIAYGVINDGANPGERTGDGAYVPMVTPARALSRVTIREYPTLTRHAGPRGLTVSSDGNIWFGEPGAGRIGYITPAGVVREFPVPYSGPASPMPWALATGTDGNVWFTDINGNNIGRMSSTGASVAYPLPSPSCLPVDITSGPDGNLWFVETTGNKVGRLTRDGALTEFELPATAQAPMSIVTGSDGNLWIAAYFQIVRMNRSGVVTGAFPVSQNPFGIAPGPDGALWFTEQTRVGRIGIDGAVKEYPLPADVDGAQGIAAGGDGNLWIAVPSANKLLRVTPGGIITAFPVPTADSAPSNVVLGQDGSVWFTEPWASQIGRVTFGP